MTKAQFERVIRTWQDRLGIAHWDITVNWGAPADSSDFAEITAETSYDKAVMRVNPNFGEWTDVFLNQVVVHELLHCVCRDMDIAVLDARSGLHPTAASQAEARYRHESEGVVDRLAIRLVEIGGVA